MDKLTPEKRSWNMSQIKGKNTAIELAVRKYLSARGFKYRIHYNLPGRPDIVFVSRKIAIFIDGDFWHGYGFSKWRKKAPSSFWLQKIEGNIQRDRKNRAKLRRQGWKVFRIWEHEIEKNLEKAMAKLIDSLL